LKPHIVKMANYTTNSEEQSKPNNDTTWSGVAVASVIGVAIIVAVVNAIRLACINRMEKRRAKAGEAKIAAKTTPKSITTASTAPDLEIGELVTEPEAAHFPAAEAIPENMLVAIQRMPSITASLPPYEVEEVNEEEEAGDDLSLPEYARGEDLPDYWVNNGVIFHEQGLTPCGTSIPLR
jgi:hypothetical protein